MRTATPRRTRSSLPNPNGKHVYAQGFVLFLVRRRNNDEGNQERKGKRPAESYKVVKELKRFPEKEHDTSNDEAWPRLQQGGEEFAITTEGDSSLKRLTMLKAALRHVWRARAQWDRSEVRSGHQWSQNKSHRGPRCSCDRWSNSTYMNE